MAPGMVIGGVCYTYGTWFGVKGLATVGRSFGTSSCICKVYTNLQADDGHWAGDYGGPMLLLPGPVITLSFTGALNAILSKEHKHEICRYLYNHQNRDGGWGLHIEGPTRKAACAALGDIASCGAACLGSYRPSCIRSLEACRFDKVKPVRDVALQALQLWKNLPGPNTAEPSEAGSSVKETSYRDDYTDVSSACDSRMKDNTLMKFGYGMNKKKVPLSSRKVGRTCIEKPQQSGRTDWKIEVAVPKNCTAAENLNDESKCSSVTKRCDIINSDGRSISNTRYEYVEADDRQEYSSVSDLFTESVKTKVVTPHGDVYDDASLVKSTGTS